MPRATTVAPLSLLVATFSSAAFADPPAAVPSGDKRADLPPIRFGAAPGEGASIETKDGKFALNLRARIQVRDTFTHDEKGDSNEFTLKTMRLWLTGHALVPELRYGIQLAFGPGDFEKDNPSPLFDAFAEYVGIRDLNIRVGQFFVPFDRARTIREYALELVDRANVVRELTLDRDVGVMLSSSDLFGTKGVLSYNLFLGGGDGKNRIGGQKLGPLVVGRLTLRPFGTFDDHMEGDLSRDKRPRLAIGVAGGYNVNASRQNSTYGTIFPAGNVSYTHAVADVVFKCAGFSVLAEGVLRQASKDKIVGEVDGAPTEAWSRSGRGYFVQAGMMLHQRVQVVARWDQLFAAKGTDPELVKLAQTAGRTVGGGVNVYLNGHALKIQTDYHYSFGPEMVEGKHVVRAQLDATF